MSKSESEHRIERDFYQRPADEQADFLANTWCNQCMEADLGMRDPVEFEQEGRIFIQGACVKCGECVTTELIEEDE